MSWWYRGDGTIVIHEAEYDEVHVITPDDPDHPSNAVDDG
jgi:hypothetical protein